jgi:hypothetical protein
MRRAHIEKGFYTAIKKQQLKPAQEDKNIGHGSPLRPLLAV